MGGGGLSVAKIGLVHVVSADEIGGQFVGRGPSAQKFLDGFLVAHTHIVVQLFGGGPESGPPEQMRH